jgi:hypothetical protein
VSIASDTTTTAPATTNLVVIIVPAVVGGVLLIGVLILTIVLVRRHKGRKASSNFVEMSSQPNPSFGQIDYDPHSPRVTRITADNVNDV